MIALALAAAATLGAGSPGLDVGPVGRALVNHMEKGLSDTKVGDWVTYQLDGGGGRVYFWRLAVVGEEKDKRGRDAYWIEVDIGEHHELKAPLSQMRLLVAKDTGMTKDGITRMVATFGYEKPQEMSDEAVAAMTEQTPYPIEPGPPNPAAAGLWIRNGKEARVMTSAGTVAAIPVEVMLKSTVLKRLWMSRQVPVLHLAKLEIPAIAHAMEVRDFGIGARSRMVLPSPDEPKIRMERYDEALPEVPHGQRPSKP